MDTGKEVVSWLRWAGDSLGRDEFEAGAAALFRAIYDRDPVRGEHAADDVYLAVIVGLSAAEARRAAKVLRRLW